MEPGSTSSNTSRIAAFSDAVIAILMTIMVLDLRPPGSELRHHTFAELVHYLTPKLTVYALSFVIIAKMWVSHHRLFCAATHVTTPLLWLNNLLLFWMSLIPFATGFVSEDQTRPVAVATYGMVLCLNAFSFTLLRHYVVTHLSPGNKDIHPHIMRYSIGAMALYALGAALAYVSTYLSFVLFILVPILSIPIDREPRAPAARPGAATTDQ
jgi:uncharacterized membrane protein